MKICLSIEEASQACSIGRTKIYESINSGALKARKLGKRTIILRKDLETFLGDLDAYNAASEKHTKS